MTFIQALYGSQYQEITQNGKDGSKGRLNGNIFLTAFIILCILLIIASISAISDAFTNQMNSAFHQIFGFSSGKTIGRLLVIPLMFIIYIIISITIGSKNNYDKIIESFNLLEEKDRKRANSKILLPFFVVLGAMFLLMMVSLF